MLDPAFVREHTETVRQRLAARGVDLSAELEQLATLESQRRRVIPSSKGSSASRTRLATKSRAPNGRALMRRRSSKRTSSARRRSSRSRSSSAPSNINGRGCWRRSPTCRTRACPPGTAAADNVVVRTWGEPRAFDFDPKAHWDLGPRLGHSRFRARDQNLRVAFRDTDGRRRPTRTRAHQLHAEPALRHCTAIRRSSRRSWSRAARLYGTGQLPKFEQDLFKIAGDWDLYLIPTAEVPVTNLYRGEILDGRRLPLKYTAYTPCFRSEAGSYGADVRGLIRQHQFDKVELVKFTTSETSYDELEGLTADAEKVLQLLGLPYRTVLLCSGDMGFSSAKTYDIEVWLPSQQCLSRDLIVLELRSVPGAAREHPLSARWHWQGGVRAHAEWIRARGRAHVDRDRRELSAGGRVGGDPRGACARSWGDARSSNQAVDKFSAGPARARRALQCCLGGAVQRFVAGCDNDETTACGGMAEWLMAAVLKTAVPERVSGVRIPLPPPIRPVPSLIYIDTRSFDRSIISLE